MFCLGKKQLNIRKANIEDVEQMWNVEQASFSKPWSKEAFVSEMTTNRFAQYYVLEIEGDIVGYAGMWIILDEAHVTNIAIHPHARGQKLGELMMRHLIAIAKMFGAKSMTLEVRVSNQIAQNLYRKLGFKEEGLRKNYYADTMEDAIIMWVNLE